MRLLTAIAALWLAQAASPAPRVVAVNIDGVVHPVTVEIVSRAADQARRENAALILIRLNTPGGTLDATRQVIEKIISSPVPVATFVTPSGGRAASAGFMILESADIAAMSPGTNTGAASPVALGQQMDPTMKRKVENDTAAMLRSVTDKRGRNSKLAESAVIEARSFTDKEALDDKLVELLASNDRDLLAKLDGREITRFDGSKQTLRLAGAEIADFQPSTRERLMSAIADPNIAFILLVLGALGIYIEFSSPGLILPGVAGAILALLGLSALSVLPINGLGVALLVLAAALFVLEAKVTSHGILGAGGAVAMILGAMLLVEGPPEIRIRLSTALAVTLPFAAITVMLVSLVVQARRNKVVTGTAGMVGETGTAQTALAPEGKVFIHGEYWDAVSEPPAQAGSRVRVTAVEGLKLKVEPLSEKESFHA